MIQKFLKCVKIYSSSNLVDIRKQTTLSNGTGHTYYQTNSTLFSKPNIILHSITHENSEIGYLNFQRWEN